MKKNILTQIYIESTNEFSSIKMYQEKEETVYYRDKYKQKYIMIDLDGIQKYQSISPATIAKIVHLASYCDYNNRLMLTKQTCMHKNNLQTVLNISERKYRDVNKELTTSNILRYSSTGEIFLANDLFYRGKRVCNKLKINIDALRSAYFNTTPRSQKYLGRVILLAPYINKTHNVICWNTEEVDENLIRPLTMTEICELLKFSFRDGDFRIMINGLTMLMFEYKGENQPVCFIDNQSKRNKKMLRINPNIISAGHIFQQDADQLIVSDHFPKQFSDDCVSI